MNVQGSTHLFHHPNHPTHLFHHPNHPTTATTPTIQLPPPPNHPTTATTPTIQLPPPPPPPSEAEAAYSKGNCHRSKIISARAVVVDAVTFAVDDGDVVVIVFAVAEVGTIISVANEDTRISTAGLSVN